MANFTLSFGGNFEAVMMKPSALTDVGCTVADVTAVCEQFASYIERFGNAGQKVYKASVPEHRCLYVPAGWLCFVRCISGAGPHASVHGVRVNFVVPLDSGASARLDEILACAKGTSNEAAISKAADSLRQHISS
jgi:hypothetical protein